MKNFVVKRKLDSLGRIVIPKEMRVYYGFKENDKLEIVPTCDGILIKNKEKNNENNR